jgi:uncharacterized membrane protein YkvA (DUF1232 family)
LSSFGELSPHFSKGFPKKKAKLISQTRDTPNLIEKCSKAVGVCVVAYALSPIDLIPDFVPVLGYLDDLVLVPLGLLLVLRLIPADVLAEHRVAASAIAERPVSHAGALAVIVVWLAAALLLAIWLGNWLGFLSAPGVRN